MPNGRHPSPRSHCVIVRLKHDLDYRRIFTNAYGGRFGRRTAAYVRAFAACAAGCYGCGMGCGYVAVHILRCDLSSVP